MKVTVLFTVFVYLETCRRVTGHSKPFKRSSTLKLLGQPALSGGGQRTITGKPVPVLGTMR